jgi:hypothetical protein
MIKKKKKNDNNFIKKMNILKINLYINGIYINNLFNFRQNRYHSHIYNYFFHLINIDSNIHRNFN